MPNKVYIDTALNSSDVEAGAKKIVDALNDVADAAEKESEKVTDSAKDTADAVTQEGEAAEEASDGMEKLAVRKKHVLKVNVEVKKVTEEVTDATQKEVEVEKELDKQQNKTHKNFELGFGKILKYTLGIKSLSATINAIKSALKESFDQLRTFDKETDNAMTDIKNSFGLFKQQLAPAFKELLLAAQPYISALIDMLTDAMIKATEFFAALSGKKTYLVAVGKNEEVADSFDDVTESVKSANRALGAYDTLLLINRQSNTGNGTGSNKSKNPIGYLYETREVSSEMEEFADKMRKVGDAVKDVGKWCLDNKDFILGIILIFEGKKCLDAITNIGKLGAAFKSLGTAVLIAGTAMIGFRVGNGLYELITGEKITQTPAEMIDDIAESFRDGSYREAFKEWKNDIELGLIALADTEVEMVKGAGEKLKSMWDGIAGSFKQAFSELTGGVSTTHENIISPATIGGVVPSGGNVISNNAAFNLAANALQASTLTGQKAGDVVLKIDGREIARAVNNADFTKTSVTHGGGHI